MEWLSQPEIWVSLLTLTVLEIVLGIDNIIFISILSGKLPAAQQRKARQVGLGLALITRILLLCGLAWMVKLTAPLFAVLGHGVSGRDLILIVGGLFLIGKATMEIHGKLEGADESVTRAIREVVRVGIPVMGHIGFTPQSVHAMGGARVQGRDAPGAAALVDGAKRLEDAGVFSIVLELLPADVAARVTAAVSVPTIGIGAGAGCDGQVLVLHDMLGLNDGFSPKFLKRYATLADEVRRAVREFGTEVRAGRYPDADHSF